MPTIWKMKDKAKVKDQTQCYRGTQQRETIYDMFGALFHREMIEKTW